MLCVPLLFRVMAAAFLAGGAFCLLDFEKHLPYEQYLMLVLPLRDGISRLRARRCAPVLFDVAIATA